MNWETIDENNTRAKVFGGWIVRTYITDSVYGFDGELQDLPLMSTVFIPDPRHEWKLEGV